MGDSSLESQVELTDFFQEHGQLGNRRHSNHAR